MNVTLLTALLDKGFDDGLVNKDAERLSKPLMKKINNRVGTYKFDNGYILEIISYIDNKNVFLIRKG